MPLLIAALIALTITTACTPVLLRWGLRVGLTDAPGARKVHSAPVPRVGGIAMAAGMLLPIAFTAPLGPAIVGFLGGVLVLLAFGVWDDRSNLDYRVKFLGQFLAVAFCMGIGGVRIEWLTFDGQLMLPDWISWLLTFGFLVGVTNAVNLADGLDGLAGGLALLCLCGLAILGAITGNSLVLAIALIESGAILGFLRFNTHPARVFMGDGGSQMLGFSIGVLAILATQREGSALSAALPLLLLGVPILDTLRVMTHRILAGRSPFAPDRNHLHHRLLDLGFAHAEAVAIVYCLQLALFLLAYFLRFESDLAILAAFSAFAALVLGGLQLADTRGWRLESDRAPGRIGATLIRAGGPGGTQRIDLLSTWGMGFGLIAYAVLVIGRSSHIETDVSLLSATLLVGLVVPLVMMGAGVARWLERVVSYIAVVLLVYLDQIAPDRGLTSGRLGWLCIGVAACAALARLLCSDTRRFRVTALDVLVAFVALVVPNLPGFVPLPANLPAGILKAVVLLYVLEMLEELPMRRPLSRAVLFALLAGVAIRGGLPLLP